MNKIILIGSSGSGKSTMARQLGDKLNVDVYHLDSLFWKPGWVEVPKNEQRETQKQLVRKDRWIIDGDYESTVDLRMNAADTVIFLDTNRYLCLYRVVNRWRKHRNKTRPDSGAGPDRITSSFLKWVWSYPNIVRPKVMEKIERLKDEKQIIILKTPKEVQTFVDRTIA
ncbi:DNA topology modulation protein [Salipaludibacillus sp. CF4.18]|uniref:DNA topology modulation protein n=1 Tax=Salipaludibacillus sp. CF4.18 TaxID=3373081 RepID=UPI003EE4507A